MAKINIKESLRAIDDRTFCKYNLLTMYESGCCSPEDKQCLAKLLYSNEDPEVIYQMLASCFNDDDISQLDPNQDVLVRGNFEIILNESLKRLNEKYSSAQYNESAEQIEFTYNDVPYTIGLANNNLVNECDGIQLFLDYDYDEPRCYATKEAAIEAILDLAADKIAALDDQEDINAIDDTMVYKVYDIEESNGRLKAKCLHESTGDQKEINLGRISTSKAIELVNAMLGNPGYEVSEDVKQKLLNNSAAWGLTIHMTPSIDVQAINNVMAVAESIDNMVKGTRVSKDKRQGTVLESDSEQCLVEWDDDDDLSWEKKECLESISNSVASQMSTKSETLLESDDDDINEFKGFFPNEGGTPEYAQYKYDRRHGAKDKSNSLGICPSCGEKSFNDSLGLCTECGYDEKSWGDTGTDDYDLDESMKGFIRTYCDECGKMNRVEVEFKDFNKPFEDTIYTCSHCGAKNLLTDPHEYNDDGTIKESLSSRYIDKDGYVSISNIANYIVDTFDGDLDDRYACINSLVDSFKDEGKVSTEVIDQFAGAHNLTDKIEESVKLTEDSLDDLDSKATRYLAYNRSLKDVVRRMLDNEDVDVFEECDRIASMYSIPISKVKEDLNKTYDRYASKAIEENVNNFEFDEEKNHPYVGKRFRYLEKDSGSIYGEVFTVTRAYDTMDGVVVRHDSEDGQYTITAKPDQYKLLKSSATEAVEDTEETDDLISAEQEFDSAATSINSNKLPAVYNMVKFNPGDVVVDFGGGKFDNAVNYLKDQDVTLLVYDPYNRSAEHNREVLRVLKEHGGADAAINSNVLNVIKEPEARNAVLQNIKKITKKGAPIYITVYEGTGKGNEGPTKSGYQLNRKTADYMDEISQVFSNPTRKGKLITAINESINEDSDTETPYTDDQLKDAKAKKPNEEAHLKGDYNIEDYREELQAYIDKETGRPQKFFVDATFDGRLVISINWGDWKHEHTYADFLVRKFFMDKGLSIGIEVDVTEENGSDTYSAEHYYEIDDIVLSGRDIEESVDTVTRYKVEYYAGDNDERLETYIYADSKEEVRNQLVAKTKSEGIDYVMITAMIPETVPASYKKNDLSEASYGGAYDIEGEQYFTRDDLVEFAEDVVERLNTTSYSKFDYTEVYMETGNILELTLVWSDYEETIKEHIDMRKIRKPHDLIRVYSPLFVFKAREVFSQDGADFGPHLSDQDYPMAESLTENALGQGKYSDKFHNYLSFLLTEGKEDNLPYLVSQLIRYCPEEDLKDLWIDRIQKTASDAGYNADDMNES